jgi:hypothetical protein
LEDRESGVLVSPRSRFSPVHIHALDVEGGIEALRKRGVSDKIV